VSRDNEDGVIIPCANRQGVGDQRDVGRISDPNKKRSPFCSRKRQGM